MNTNSLIYPNYILHSNPYLTLILLVIDLGQNTFK